MKTPEVTQYESQRIEDLFSYSILDSLPEREYDAIAEIAAAVCHATQSIISLIDDKRQWFKAAIGLEGMTEVPKEFTVCTRLLEKPFEILEIHDVQNDPRVGKDSFLRSSADTVFYAGVPLVSEAGYAIGTLCVIDNKKNALNDFQKKSLKALANQVIQLMELRKSRWKLQSSKNILEHKNQDLDAFARVVAHDLKSPLAGIAGLAQVVMDNYGALLPKDGIDVMKMIKGSSLQLINLVNGVMDYSRGAVTLTESKEEIDLKEFFEDLVMLIGKGHKIEIPNLQKVVLVNRTALHQIFINLLTNAIKYNDKEQVEIIISFRESPTDYFFIVKDNGKGIEEKNFDLIFDLFKIVSHKDRDGQKGNGIGLSTVKKLVEGMGGRIQVTSELRIGTSFEFSIAKE